MTETTDAASGRNNGSVGGLESTGTIEPSNDNLDVGAALENEPNHGSKKGVKRGKVTANFGVKASKTARKSLACVAVHKRIRASAAAAKKATAKKAPPTPVLAPLTKQDVSTRSASMDIESPELAKLKKMLQESRDKNEEYDTKFKVKIVLYFEFFFAFIFCFCY